MKARSLPVIFLLLLASGSLSAAPVGIGQAKQVAMNFLTRVYSVFHDGHQAGMIDAVNPYVYTEGGAPVFYAFSTNPGFIIISGDDAYVPVIGYSFEGQFAYETAPSHVRGFIRNFIDQILYIRKNGITPGPKIAAAWKSLAEESPQVQLPERDAREVEPLLMSTWNQGSPYNVLCPEDPSGPGGHAYVGCVATAMAQILYYWRFPDHGIGEHCYWPWNYDMQCADFGNTYYAWDGMINSIDNFDPYPNAELQYHCAVSVDMEFGPNGSSSSSWTVPYALWEYWKYFSAEYMEKDYYDPFTWSQMLMEDLVNGRPIYYSGFSSNAGHAFVCDGFQGDIFDDPYFHFNFGWSGSMNGYYTLEDVGGFSFYQGCVMWIEPWDFNYPYYASGDDTLARRSGSLTDGSGPLLDYLDDQSASWLLDMASLGDSIVDITLQFYQFDLASGDTVKVYDGPTTGDSLLAALTGNEIPGVIHGTGTQMLVTFQADGSGTASGWYAEFMAHTAVYCQGMTMLTEPFGYFEDGSGTYNYHDNSACLWRIAPPDANIITLTFEQFDTEETNDFLTIVDGTTEIGDFSGHEIPDPIVATNGSIFLAWHTNGSDNYQGWKAYYEVDNVGVEEDQPFNSLRVYPNPASGKLNVMFHTDRNTPVEISLVGPEGRTVLEEEAGRVAGSHHQVLDISGLAAGIYFLEVDAAGLKQVRKVVVR
jgi:hypothetical protein